MNAKSIKQLKTNPQLQNRLAKYMALTCFRNTELENLHAGTSPSSATGDFSDVKVVSPYGEIPWTEVSRFDDDEMKKLMQDVVWRCYVFLKQLFDADQSKKLIRLLELRDLASTWDDPFPPDHVMHSPLLRDGDEQAD